MPEDSSTAPNKQATKQHSHMLTYLICGAIVAAIALALLFPQAAMSLEIGGEVFLRLLKMIVVPLVFTSVLCGILGMGDVRKLGKPGVAAIGYYIITTILAVTVGLIVVNLVNPGGGFDQQKLAEIRADDGVAGRERILGKLSENLDIPEDEVAKVFPNLKEGKQVPPTLGQIFKNLLLMLVADNLFEAAAKTQLLPIIVFAILFGGMLTTMRTKVGTLTSLIEETNNALMKFVLLLMNVAPLGIFCLVTSRFGEAVHKGEFLEQLSQIGAYFATVLLGLGIHVLVTLPLIFWIVRRENPYRYMMDMSQALLTAFSTASSSATLPVTMECAEEAGISRRSTEFVLPLGATINMDGTALYEAVAAIFIAQATGLIELTMTVQITIAVTATLAAIGAAGIPEAGLVTMMIVLNAVGLPVEYIGLILSIDWLLDRFRTMVNTFGDSVGAAIVEKTLPPEPDASVL